MVVLQLVGVPRVRALIFDRETPSPWRWLMLVARARFEQATFGL